MVSSKRLVKMARKWRRVAALARRRISSTTSTHESVVAKGHFVAYTTEGRRFMVPLPYLNNSILIELLRVSEDEFGLPANGPITLPCDAAFMEYVMSLLRGRAAKDVEMALLSSMLSDRCCLPGSLFHLEHSQQPLVCGF